MLYIAQIVGLIGNAITSADFVGKQGLWVLVIMLFPCEIYILFFFKTEFNRKKLEHAHTLSTNQINLQIRGDMTPPRSISLENLVVLATSEKKIEDEKKFVDNGDVILPIASNPGIILFEKSKKIFSDVEFSSIKMEDIEMIDDIPEERDINPMSS